MEKTIITMDEKKHTFNSILGGLCPLLIFLLFIGSFSLRAQDFSLSFSYNGTLSSNLFNNYEKIGDFINRGLMDFSIYPSRELEFYISSGYSIFKENSYLNFLTVEIGLDWIKYFEGRSMIHLNAGINLQQFKMDYDYYNYYESFLQGDFKYYLSDSVLFRTSYNFEHTKFVYFPAYSSQKHEFFVQLNKFLPFKMTLRGEVGARLKRYTDDGSTIKQLYARVRISKGIGYRVGLTGQWTVKRNFVSETIPGKIEENFFFTTPFYDDFSWEGHWGFAQFKAILPYEIEFTARASYYERKFPKILALDLAGNPIEPFHDREDVLKQLSFSMKRKWPGFQISLTYMMRSNSSNDPYFAFSDYVLMLSTGFFLY